MTSTNNGAYLVDKGSSAFVTTANHRFFHFEHRRDLGDFVRDQINCASASITKDKEVSNLVVR